MTTVWTLAVGTTGGLLGHVLNLPAGALLGSLAAVAGYNVLREGRAQVPRWLRSPSRILVGATIGSLATPALLRSLGASVGWAAAVTTAVVAAGLALGLLLARTTGMDRRTALLASCPGGIAEMVALAEQSRADVEVVLGIQLIRKLVILIGICTVVALL
jgi:membrane AbrB-like protein